MSKGIYYRATVPGQDFRALSKDLLRPFLRIRGKNIRWNQDFLANRLRLAKIVIWREHFCYHRIRTSSHFILYYGLLVNK